jgi:hypothetical protein
MEHEIKEVVVRPRKNNSNIDGGEWGEEFVRDTLRLHGFLLEQFGNELNLLVDIIMTMDGKFDDIKDELECRFQETDYKFEVVFEELSALRARRRITRGR